MTRPALRYDFTCFSGSTPFEKEIFRIGYCIRGICTSDKYFLFKWSTVCKACIFMYYHMVGWTASFVSPFYSILPKCDAKGQVLKTLYYLITKVTLKYFH